MISMLLLCVQTSGVLPKAREHFRSVTVYETSVCWGAFSVSSSGAAACGWNGSEVCWEAEQSLLIVKLRTLYASVFWLYSPTSCISCYHVTILKDIVYGWLFLLLLNLFVVCCVNINDGRLLSLPGRSRADWHVATQPVDAPDADDTLMASLISRCCVITVVLAQTSDFGVLLASQTH